MTMDDIVVRCSTFSGWNLTWKVELVAGVPCLMIEDPTNRRSALTVMLRGCMDKHFGLREVHGRLGHYAITPEEERVMELVLATYGKPLPGGPAHVALVTKDVIDQYFLYHGWKEEDIHKATPELRRHAAESMGVQEELSPEVQQLISHIHEIEG